MFLWRAIPSVMFLALAAVPADAGTRQRLAGPVNAEVVRVIDGDTLVVRATVWIGQSVEVLVRVRGIDAPERRSACAFERRLAARATAYVRAMTGSGRVVLTDISGGKYFGRVLAEVATSKGNDVASALLARRLVRPYRGRARAKWCRSGPPAAAGAVTAER